MNKLNSVGDDTSTALRIGASWLPTTFAIQQKGLTIDELFLNVFNESMLTEYRTLQNVSTFVNWTVCTLKTMWQQEQMNNFKNKLFSSHVRQWTDILPIGERNDTWLLLQPEYTECTPRWCAGRLIAFNVKNPTLLCKFIVMPMVMIDPVTLLGQYWVPEMKGTHIDSHNKTRNIDLCQLTEQGYVCNEQSGIYEPCLMQQQDNVCALTIIPQANLQVYIEVGPQHVCLITNDKQTLSQFNLTGPFSGCLYNVTHLTWGNQTIVFLPTLEEIMSTVWVPEPLPYGNFSLPLEELKQVLQKSKDVKKLIAAHNVTVSKVKILATIALGK
ncbi:uncharacterized protein LOC142722160 [Rhinoderma darwinii]|uniref:uncharacterized protein LOC142722160 n=1 Tax=Rhinoderma darwinii TaxID=43563 RepID=UPI003F66B3FD